MKTLKVALPQNCIGCEMCVMEAQRQLKKVGLDGSLIRIFRTNQESANAISSLTEDKKVIFQIEIDPQISQLEIAKIKDICPTGVFSIEETPDGHTI